MGRPLVLGWAWRQPLDLVLRWLQTPAPGPSSHPPRNFLLLWAGAGGGDCLPPSAQGSSCSDVQLGAPGCRGAEVP